MIHCWAEEEEGEGSTAAVVAAGRDASCNKRVVIHCSAVKEKGEGVSVAVAVIVGGGFTSTAEKEGDAGNVAVSVVVVVVVAVIEGRKETGMLGAEPGSRVARARE